MEKEKKPFNKKYMPYAVVASLTIIVAAGGIYAAIGGETVSKTKEPKQVTVAKPSSDDSRKAVTKEGAAEERKSPTIGSIFARVEERTTGSVLAEAPTVANSPVSETLKQLARVPEETPKAVTVTSPPTIVLDNKKAETPPVATPEAPNIPDVPVTPAVPEQPTDPIEPIFPVEPNIPVVPVEPPVTPPIEPETPIVVNQPPSIMAEDRTIHVGDSFDALAGVTATDEEDGDLTAKITVLYSNVNTAVEGTYTVTYEVEDSQNGKATKSITVNVVNEAPTLVASDKTILVGEVFDPLEGVTAMDAEEGDLTSKIEVMKNDVNSNVPGAYEVSYRVVDSYGKSSGWITIVVTVQVPENTAPIILAEDKTVTIGDTPDWLVDVTATDAEDGDITANIEVDASGIDLTTPGEYWLVYSVTDSQGLRTLITVQVTVVEASLIVEE
ncbi:DUF5011 domain-containing protein [Listeria booriae]|uniref:immunoglobulin-like domain-containing protein n=1 Tax=Listeria booriae TaxID=1552123 RepID=UPI0016251B46|nr:immunoglobulin-like domain-containing protein [Listeria booriae]MBC1920317.1 DUF5011 domain-containing protein [Listeria booriae]